MHRIGRAGEEDEVVGAAASPHEDELPATPLEVSGPVTLAEAPRWREALLSALAAGGEIRIDLGASGPWDLVGLQLLLSALAWGRRSGRAGRFARVPEVCRA